MANKIFKAEQFTPTKWDTAEQKAKFANQFVKFLQSNFNYSKFPKWFYTRLSMTFGHIAHYDRNGFFNTFFMNPNDKVKFIKYTLDSHSSGDPSYCYSDVETAVKQWIREDGALTFFEQQAEAFNYRHRKMEASMALAELRPEDRQALFAQYGDK